MFNKTSGLMELKPPQAAEGKTITVSKELDGSAKFYPLTSGNSKVLNNKNLVSVRKLKGAAR